MKRIAAHTFVILYLLAMARPVVPLAEYIIYEDYIAEFLCINKENTELQCNGKCYLMQRLSEQNEEKKQNLPKIAMEEYPIGFVELTSFNTQKKDKAYPQVYFDYQNHYTYLFTPNNFHPPSTII
ncbi:hypothetical protein [Flagellimonas myxillae]|uniref:hypothetical protein n=1 Tax=Flagellimonas myxillae TaxID=2942214 RepID=UPI00201ED1B4|nr:hypothetical protein [Muricauda myxillae]MCL6267507.1 hypothetical protein [Muricauda myxillae]